MFSEILKGISNTLQNLTFIEPTVDEIIDDPPWYKVWYVRDLVVSVVRRILKQALGPLVERKSGANVKENLLKDIYNIYSLGGGSIQSLPKNMIKIDNKSQCQSVQTDSCLSNTIFASKLDLDTLRAELLNKITDIRHEVLKAIPHYEVFFC